MKRIKSKAPALHSQQSYLAGGHQDREKEHPIKEQMRINKELREENRFLEKALFFTEILAAGFFGAFLAVMGAAGWL